MVGGQTVVKRWSNGSQTMVKQNPAQFLCRGGWVSSLGLKWSQAVSLSLSRSLALSLALSRSLPPSLSRSLSLSLTWHIRPSSSTRLACDIQMVKRHPNGQTTSKWSNDIQMVKRHPNGQKSNCGQAIVVKRCSHCGQPTAVKRQRSNGGQTVAVKR